jgi:hypothetical protein
VDGVLDNNSDIYGISNYGIYERPTFNYKSGNNSQQHPVYDDQYIHNIWESEAVRFKVISSFVLLLGFIFSCSLKEKFGTKVFLQI